MDLAHLHERVNILFFLQICPKTERIFIKINRIFNKNIDSLDNIYYILLITP